MPAATASHTTRFRRFKIVVMWIIIGAAIGAPIALAIFATAHRHPITAPLVRKPGSSQNRDDIRKPLTK
jgi:hypothetical protein